MGVFVDSMFELKVLACMFNVRDFMAVASQHLKPAHFSDALSNNLAKIAIDAYKMHNTLVTDHVLIQSIKRLIKKRVIAEGEADAYLNKYNQLKTTDCQDHAFVLDELVTFLKNREWKNLIDDAVTKLLANGNYDELERRAESIRAISVAAQQEYFKYYDKKRMEERYHRRENEKTSKIAAITSGIPKLDDALYGGGWRRKEFYLILGDTKMGKTMACLWFANSAQWAGFNVLYVTHETSIDVLEDRVDAMNTNTKLKNVTQDNRKIIEHMMQRKPEGNIYFVECPTSKCTVEDLDSMLDKLEADGVIIDMLVSDYLDIMNLGPIKGDDILFAEKKHYEKFRGVLVERNIVGMSPLQVTKSEAGKQRVSAAGGRGSYEKIATCDGLLTLAGDDAMRENNDMTMTTSRFRNAPPSVINIKTDFSTGRFYKEFVNAGI